MSSRLGPPGSGNEHSPVDTCKETPSVGRTRHVKLAKTIWPSPHSEATDHFP